MKVKFCDENPPAKGSELGRLQRAIGSSLPSDLATFLSERNGSSIEPNTFQVGDSNDSGVSEFLSVDQIIALKQTHGEELASNVWPIAYAEGGNYVCLRQDPAGWRVVFWDHETDEETVLAESLTEFFKSLKHPAPVKLQPGQVISVWVDPAFLAKNK